MIRYVFLLLFSILIIPSASSQSKSFEGNWTKVGTTYNFPFQLHLVWDGDQIEGVFIWQVQESDRNNLLSDMYYQAKLGLTAREYVKGKFDAHSGNYLLEGYKKDDPHQIISLDIYELTIDDTGQLSGRSHAHGSWKGRINGNENQLAL